MSWARSFLEGITWNGWSSFISIITQVTLMILLARIVDAHELGILAMAFVFMRVTLPFVDAGFSNAVIQQKHWNPSSINVLYTLQWFIGILLFLLMTFIGPIIWEMILESKDGWENAQWVRWTFLIAPIGLLHLAHLKRELQFKTVGKIITIAAIMELIVGIILILTLKSIIAVIWAYLVRHLLISVLAKFHDYAPIFFPLKTEWQWDGGLIKFGAFDMASLWVNQLSTNVDRLIIGNVLGTTALGVYALAWDTVISPLAKVSGVVNATLYPLFSKYQEVTETMGKQYHHTLRAFWYIGLPFLFLLTIKSDFIVHLFYGDQWSDVALILPLLCLVAAFKILAYLGHAVILAKGYPQVNFWWNVFWTFGLTLSIYLGLQLIPELHGAIYGQLISALALGFIWHLLIWKIGRFSYAPIIITLARGILFLAPAVLSFVFIQSTSFYIETLIIALGLVFYAWMIWSYEKNTILTLMQKLKL